MEKSIGDGTWRPSGKCSAVSLNSSTEKLMRWPREVRTSYTCTTSTSGPSEREEARFRRTSLALPLLINPSAMTSAVEGSMTARLPAGDGGVPRKEGGGSAVREGHRLLCAPRSRCLVRTLPWSTKHSIPSDATVATEKIKHRGVHLLGSMCLCCIARWRVYEPQLLFNDSMTSSAQICGIPEQ